MPALQTLPNPKKYSLLLIALVTLWHLLIAGQVNLSVDEAHYALYGQFLDWSYFDHPPLVGWINGLVLQLGQSDWALRIVPILFFALSNFLLYAICQRLYPALPWLGFWTLALFNLSVMFQLLGLSMLPDTPLMPLSLLIFWVFLNLRETPKDQAWQFQVKHWLILGGLLGLAGLAKYTAINLVISLILISLIEKRTYWLRSPAFWLSILIAALLISPILIWNAQHDWASIAYQFNHGTQQADWRAIRFLQSQLAQMAVYGPVLYLLGLTLLLRQIVVMLKPTPPNPKKPDLNAHTLLTLMAAPPLFLFGFSSGFEMTLPHWTQLGWLFIMPVVAHQLITIWQKPSKYKRLYQTLVYVGLGFSLALFLLLNLLFAKPHLNLPLPQHPLAQLTGWPQAIERAQQLQQAQAARSPNATTPTLFAVNWSQASRIAWYSQQKVLVADQRFDQFDLWFGQPQPGQSGLMVVPQHQTPPQATSHSVATFATCSQLERLYLPNPEQAIVYYDFYLCDNYLSPAP